MSEDCSLDVKFFLQMRCRGYGWPLEYLFMSIAIRMDARYHQGEAWQ